MVRQEIYGYLLTHYAISALICKAATAAGVTRTGQVQAHRPHHPPPGRRPGFFPLSTPSAPSPG